MMQIALLFALALGVSQQVDTKFSFKNTFKPPRHDQGTTGKSDDCEVLERSNFSQEDADDISLRFGNVGGGERKTQPQLVYYPFMFNAPYWNPYCNRDKEITVKIQRGSSPSTTQKPAVFCPGKHKDADGVSVLSDKELKFLSDYLDDEDGDVATWDYFDGASQEAGKKHSSGSEEIVIKIVEKSPPCQNHGTVSDKLDFVKVKLSDVMGCNGTCSYSNNDLTGWLRYVKGITDVASCVSN